MRVETPFKVTFMAENFFPSLQPDCHLCVFIAVVRCPVSVFCQIDVEALRILSIVVISCPEQFDRVNVVSKGVELREVEIISDSERDKDVLVLVELFEGFVQELEGFGCVQGILGEVEEIQEGADGTDEGDWGGAVWEFQVDDKSEENATHISMLLSSDPRKGGDPFGEKTDVVIGREASATGVEVFLTKGCCDP